jgi:predicted ester cyclase
MNAGQVAAYLSYFTPTCLRWVAGFDQPLTLNDVEMNLQQLVDAFTPLVLQEELLMSDGAFVCARWRLQGTQTGEFLGLMPVGGRIDVSTCEIYEIYDAKVVTVWTYQDPGQLFRQMGPRPEQ